MITFARVFAFFFSPLGLTIAAAVALGGIYLKIRNDGVQAERARIERENRNAIDKARSAADAAADKFDSNPADGVPNDQLRD